MKISKTSWHYRLMRQLFDYECQIPTDLCHYVRMLLWKSFWHSVFFILVVVFLSVFAWGFFYLPIATLIALWTDWMPFGSFFGQHHYEVGLFMWLIYGVAFVVGLIGRGISALRSRRRTRKELAHAAPGIFMQRYDDWKNKVCTRLEFTDGPT